MARCKLSPQEFIGNAFTPQIAVICSPKAEETCRKNNLSFTELLQPFCKLGTEAHYKDPIGTVIPLRNFKISLQDIDCRPPQPVLARKFLNSSVSNISESRLHTVKIGEQTLEVPYSTPWFEAWRDTFLQVQFPSDHEFIKHFIACMLVVATNDDNPVRTMADLAQKVNDLQTSPKLPKWFSNNVMRYYVIIHETGNVNHVHAVEFYDTLKTSYGGYNCFLLKMNSRPTSQNNDQLPDPWTQFIATRINCHGDYITPDPSPSSSATDLSLEDTDKNNLYYHPLDSEENNLSACNNPGSATVLNKTGSVPHGACLSMEDIEQLKLLIHEFCMRALLPFVERQLSNLYEYITTKKGVSRSLFTATKRWFAPHKPGSSGNNTPTYYLDAPELQVRRLGDLCFMFGNYSMAFQAYHTAKRDFNADQAWLHYAGALEMAALSAFMANEMSKKTLDYIEDSITTYLNTCKMAQFATRTTLFSFECLKERLLYGDAANQLIRMTSEESDLRSALLLEQAAYCFLNSVKPTMVRKYAFHMVLAGHRFSKAAQKKHSLRCYKQAHQVFVNKGWNLALDHIYCTIGKQANNLDLLEESAESYAKLLNENSRQTPQQQALFLKEYLTIHDILSKKRVDASRQTLPLPLLNSKHIKVLVAPTLPLRTPGRVPAMGVTLSTEDDPITAYKWQKLEELLIQEAQGSLPMLFKPLITLFTRQNCTTNPTATVGEPIQVSVQTKNPLQIILCLTDIYLLWECSDGDGKFVTNEISEPAAEQFVKTHYIKSTVLQANSVQDIVLTLTPLVVGQIALKAVCYSLISPNDPDGQVELKGKQVFRAVGQNSRNENCDEKLYIDVVPPAASLQISFCEVNSELLRNELQKVSVELRNVGSVPLCKLYMASSTPHLLSSCDFSQDYNTTDNIGLELSAAGEKEIRKYHTTSVSLQNDRLDPGQQRNITIWIKAPDLIGPASVDLLVYYENMNAVNIPKYRLVRHVWNFSIRESIEVDVATQHCYNSTSSQRLALSVTARNTNKIHHPVVTEITLLNATLLSDDWMLSKETATPEDVRLNSQESVHTVLKAQRREKKDNIYSSVSFVPQKYGTHDANSVAGLDFARRLPHNSLNIFNADDSATSDDKRKNKLDAILALRWEARVIDGKGSERTAHGQTPVPIHVLEAEESEDEDEYVEPIVIFDTKQSQNTKETIQTKNLEDVSVLERQVCCNLAHPLKIRHNFNKKKLCIIKTKMLLYSISDTNLEVTIKMLETSRRIPTSSNRLTLFSPYSSKHFRWIRTGNLVRRINSSGSEAVDLSLAVLGPGTYDLGSHMEVWCQKENQPQTAILQTCRIHSSIIVAFDDSL